jgi:hypothetical protein
MNTPAINIDLSDDGQTVTLGNQMHSHAFPVADLPRWTQTYTRLRDRKGGAFAHHYRQTCDDLAALAARLATLKPQDTPT